MLRPAIVIGSRCAASVARRPTSTRYDSSTRANDGPALALLEAGTRTFRRGLGVADPHLDEPRRIARHELAVDRREQRPRDPVRFGYDDRPPEPVPPVAGLHEHVERIPRTGHLAQIETQARCPIDVRRAACAPVAHASSRRPRSGPRLRGIGARRSWAAVRPWSLPTHLLAEVGDRAGLTGHLLLERFE